MDGIEGRAGVTVVAATNRSDLIDTALLRPGRFDLVVELEYPDESERCTIFGIHTKDKPVDPEISMEELAHLTQGRNGADLEAICRRASLLAMREWIAPKLNMLHVEVTEATEDGSASNDNSASTADLVTSPEANLQQVENTLSSVLPSQFQIRMNHFLQAINEQNERYDAQEVVEQAQSRKEAGRQRLIEMAADINTQGKPQRRGFRLWLARLFGLVP
jgi:transitional endoplasmic reticulum ATPase